MSKACRVPAITLPLVIMRDIRKESIRSGQTITAVVRARLVGEYENRIAKDDNRAAANGRAMAREAAMIIRREINGGKKGGAAE